MGVLPACMSVHDMHALSTVASRGNLVLGDHRPLTSALRRRRWQEGIWLGWEGNSWWEETGGHGIQPEYLKRQDTPFILRILYGVSTSSWWLCFSDFSDFTPYILILREIHPLGKNCPSSHGFSFVNVTEVTFQTMSWFSTHDISTHIRNVLDFNSSNTV